LRHSYELSSKKLKIIEESMTLPFEQNKASKFVPQSHNFSEHMASGQFGCM
jgi:hypothetical protein